MTTIAKSSLKNSALSYVTKVLLGTLFLAVSAQIAIPFYPVPMTMQGAALMIIGLSCSPALAASIVGAYIMEAALGLPVLSNFSGGLEVLLGTRGGYIFGFLPLAFLTSFFKHLRDTIWFKILGCILGNSVLYLMGISWLSHFVGLEKALVFGLYPFLLQVPIYIGFAILSTEFLKKYIR